MSFILTTSPTLNGGAKVGGGVDLSLALIGRLALRTWRGICATHCFVSTVAHVQRGKGHSDLKGMCMYGDEGRNPTDMSPRSMVRSQGSIGFLPEGGGCRFVPARLSSRYALTRPLLCVLPVLLIYNNESINVRTRLQVRCRHDELHFSLEFRKTQIYSLINAGGGDLPVF